MNDLPFAISRRSALIGAAVFAAAVPLRAAAQALPGVTVSKDPSCGCCGGWIAHLRASGFSVTAHDTTDMSAVKTRLGVPAHLVSCHTAEVGGYVIEGHVPASAIKRLLSERPAGRGLAAPGMPQGSPGMEGGAVETYDVILFGGASETVFARYKGAEPA